MSTVAFYGYSDDLVEIAGDVSEEFDLIDADTAIGLSDGTLVGVKYDDEDDWRFRVIELGEGTEFALTPASVHKGELPDSARGISADLVNLPDYSDLLVLRNPRSGAFNWAVLALGTARRAAGSVTR